MTDIGIPGHMCNESPPDTFVTLEVLHRFLFKSSTPDKQTDAVWRYILGNATDKGGRWSVFMVAVAARELMRHSLFIVPRGTLAYPEDKRYVQQHLIVAFWIEIQRVTEKSTRIGKRAIWRAAKRAKAAHWYKRESELSLLPPKDEAEPESDEAEPGPAEPGPAERDLPPDIALPHVLSKLVARTADVKPSRSDRRAQVTAKDASMLELCVVYGRTIREAAEELQLSESAAKSRMPEAKRAVFELLASPYLKNRRPQWSRDPDVRKQYQPDEEDQDEGEEDE